MSTEIPITMSRIGHKYIKI